ncbi:5-formyltetrahydrofolate cyclo-ligase [Flavobacterium sp. NST-5]|uniref:5-formyltetrahydrofolate cyclo-ligase n=1 Tax=Flavobacterium ichthyis TaxID=2698827 RepID=A0ABW9Z9B0_9FLAO|nr:5-formyltetrahydrofolate cyclo-ligase [Flavobacterium ichthyis]NBL65463.1 5-formyltetrahydrofolate cyclo-ligase [Flavobacterium ichthyis]
MTKKELRNHYKKLRENLSAEDVETKSMAIANMALQGTFWHKQIYHIYLPIIANKEVDTEFLLQILSGKDKDIVVSKADFSSRSMTHFLLTDSTKFVVNSHGIPEPENGFEVNPEKIEVVFMPLLAYDIKGNRVGYGKGFYDNFLRKCTPETIKIGLSFFEPETEIDGIFEGDIPMDFCITPSKIYSF